MPPFKILGLESKIYVVETITFSSLDCVCHIQDSKYDSLILETLKKVFVTTISLQSPKIQCQAKGLMDSMRYFSNILILSYIANIPFAFNVAQWTTSFFKEDDIEGGLLCITWFLKCKVCQI